MAEEDKKKQEKVEELNKDSSFANMMAELSQVAKVTKVKEPEKKKLLVEPEKKKEKEVTTKEEKQGLLQQLSQLAVETKTPIVKLEKAKLLVNDNKKKEYQSKIDFIQSVINNERDELRKLSQERLAVKVLKRQANVARKKLEQFSLGFMVGVSQTEASKLS